MYERDTQSTTSADTTMQPLASDEREEGILILGGTPIGNLSDASDRLRQVLATADVIAVEDTRKLRTLASGLGVHTTGRVIVNHDHNEEYRSTQLRPRLCCRIRRCRRRPAGDRDPRSLGGTDCARALWTAHWTVHL